MSDEERDWGGYAFPVTWVRSQFIARGMTLRDYFAAQALHCIDPSNISEHDLLRMFGGRSGSGITKAEIAAALAYDVADAMIERRKK